MFTDWRISSYQHFIVNTLPSMKKYGHVKKNTKNVIKMAITLNLMIVCSISGLYIQGHPIPGFDRDPIN